MEYYLAIKKKNEILPLAITRVDPEGIMLREIKVFLDHLLGLVGSEMCIRDSPYFQYPPGTIYSYYNIIYYIPYAVLYIPCLLYTSDAADDWLVV